MAAFLQKHFYFSAVRNRLWQHARVVKVKKDNYYDIYFHYFAAVFAVVVIADVVAV